MKKSVFAVLLVPVMVLGMCMPVFAAGWSDTGRGMVYVFDDGSVPDIYSWRWIDDNGDGIYQCYYFGNTGLRHVSSTTPDGCTVNENGEWTVDGVVQEKTSEQLSEDFSETSCPEAGQFGEMLRAVEQDSEEKGLACYLKSNETNTDYSIAIGTDHYYEVLGCSLLEETTFPKETVEALENGGQLTLGDGTNMNIRRLIRNGNGYSVDMEHSSENFVDMGDFYVLDEEDGDSDMTPVWTGNLYFRKDCKINGISHESDYRPRSVDTHEYFTNGWDEKWEYGLRSGNYGSANYFVVYGNAEVDENGFIISYTEKFHS